MSEFWNVIYDKIKIIFVDVSDIYNNVYVKIFIIKFLFIILLIKFSNKIEFLIYFYMVIC